MMEGPAPVGDARRGGGAPASSGPRDTAAAGTAAADTAGERAARVREGFTALLGGDAVAAAGARWSVGPVEPAAVLLPEDEEQVAAALRLATERGWRTLPAGAGTWLRAGGPLGAVDAVLSVRRLDRIVQYEAADLTVTAGAGHTLATLGRTVAQEGQWLPLDAIATDEATLGATLATASSGPLALAYGAPRDLVLGVRLVTGDGRSLGLGGRVVKNVAGFDMVKLAVGSWGTLGVITETTVRLFPRPESDVRLIARAERLEDLVAAARALATAEVAPASLELFEAPASGAAPGERRREARLVARIVGSGAGAAREAERLEARLAGLDVERREGEPAADGPGHDPSAEGELALRLSLPAPELGDLIRVARDVGRLDGARDELAATPYRIAVDAARGSVRLTVPHLRAEPPWGERWAERLRELRGTLERRGGGLTIEVAPAAVAGRVPAWGHPGRAAARLITGMRAQFDPGRILSPGRWTFEED